MRSMTKTAGVWHKDSKQSLLTFPDPRTLGVLTHAAGMTISGNRLRRGGEFSVERVVNKCDCVFGAVEFNKRTEAGALVLA